MGGRSVRGRDRALIGEPRRTTDQGWSDEGHEGHRSQRKGHGEGNKFLS
jgi:hypothetical protein